MDKQSQSLLSTITLIRSDMQFRCDYEHKQLTALRVLAFLTNHAVISQILYRFQIFFHLNHLGIFASIFKGINSLIFTVNIHSKTQIGEGLLMLHPNYIFIGKNVVLGKRCILAQQNSIGPAYVIETEAGVSDQGPIIGDDVLCGVGCAIFGNISIGSRSKISVNTAVDKSFPSNAILIGVPAKNLSLS
ncbi:hypothetical protein [Methylotenera sp.]|uniref:hypothetical protein n=1 Tax=Methylotenera sp. TaxID=2051956 RepID=UPI00248929C0|nr:hypothetical protein [Methylotenera sp.]MDI1297807.1 hypothetical protein [Methylotenera sp.]